MEPIKVILVGAGDRAKCYANYALKNPDNMQVVGIVEPDDYRRQHAMKKYGVLLENTFRNVDELMGREKFADAIINGTMDHQHVATAIPTLEKGYDLLLEKPFALNEDDVNRLNHCAKKHNRKVMICHVLRYAPFYRRIKDILLKGELGEIINLHTYEHISYHHMAVSFVKGKWRSEESCQAPILLAKCCHDIDLLMWFNAETSPAKISSFGGRYYFTADNKPKGAGSRCLTDCPIEEDCIYSAKKHYIDKPDRWKQYVWRHIQEKNSPSLEDKIHSLSTDNPFGRCVWDMDNTVDDRQTVSIQFGNGSMATHNLVGGASRGERGIHIVCTHGEIIGTFQDSIIKVRRTHPTSTSDFEEEIIDLNITGDMDGAYGGHGGGDQRLVIDFINYVRGNDTSVSLTTLEDSTRSHLSVFRAEQSKKQNTIMDY